jgi:hypothetical protein
MLKVEKKSYKKFKIVEKMLNDMKNEMFDQSMVKTIKTIKCLTKVLSKHLKQSNV